MPYAFTRIAPWLALIAAALLFIVPFIATFIPLLPGNNIIPSFGFKWLGLATGLAAIILLPYIHGTGDGMRVPYIVAVPLGLIMIALYQAVSVDTPYLEPYLVFATCLIWAMGLMILGATLARHVERERIVTMVAWLAMLGGLIASIIGLLQVAGVPDALSKWILVYKKHIPIGNVGQVNFFTCHVMLGLTALVALFGSGRVSLRTFLPLLLIFAGVLAFTSSRAIYLYFFITLFWAGWVEYKTGSKEAKRLFLAMAAATGIFLLLHFCLPALIERFSELSFNTALTRLEKFNDVESGQLSSRKEAWNITWQLFLEHPLLGVGIGEYRWHHFQLEKAGGLGAFGHPHNLILFFMATTGIAGTSLVLALLFLTARQILRFAQTPVFWLPSAMLLIILIYSMLEFPFWLPAFLGIAAFIGGLLLADGWQFRETGLKTRLLFGCASLLAVFLLFKTLVDYQRLSAVDRGRLAVELIDNEVRIARRNLWLQPYAEQFFVKGDLTSKQALSARLKINSRLLHWNQTERTLGKQIILLSMAGDTEAALALFDKAARSHKRISSGLVKFCHNQSAAELEQLCAAAKAKLDANTSR